MPTTLARTLTFVLSILALYLLVLGVFALTGCGAANAPLGAPDLYQSKPPEEPVGTSPSRLGLVGWWAFQDLSRGVVDSSGGGSNGVIAGQIEKVPGKVGLAAHFDGRSCARFDVYPVLDASSWRGMTMMAWVQPAPCSGLECAYERGTVLSRGDQYGHYVRQRGALRAEERVAAGGDRTLADAGGLSGGWQHLAVTWDGASVRHYVDGAEVSARVLAGAMGVAQAASAFRIGCDAPPEGGETDNFIGDLDEVMLYNTALPAGTIASYYARTR